MEESKVVIIGGGFVGLNCARKLAGSSASVTLIDKRNHHLFQPLLYQVAMAGLSPADIATPIRAIFNNDKNIKVLQDEVTKFDLKEKKITTGHGSVDFDYLVVAAGASHSYFGHPEWEICAPGLKTLSQATEIRRRVLTAFEEAEKSTDPEKQKMLLTFVVIGGGPTGVELAGAIGEMSRYTLAKDFRSIDSKLSRTILLEAGSRILPSFSLKQASHATRELEKLGVQVWTRSRVTDMSPEYVQVGSERVHAGTVLWAAGVKASDLGEKAGWKVDRQGRVVVGSDLTVPDHARVFVAGDMACALGEDGKPLPGLASVALQQGRFIGETILADIEGKPRKEFHYFDKGQMATIGRSRSILEYGSLKLTGFLAWLVWLVVHIYYLTGFRNRTAVVLQWAWSYLYYKRGARLIVPREWRTESIKKTVDTKGDENGAH
ncbi:MAG: NAD(P)/FAD-dependent oxidoreductase [Oligoflexales bacterium]